MLTVHQNETVRITYSKNRIISIDTYIREEDRYIPEYILEVTDTLGDTYKFNLLSDTEQYVLDRALDIVNAFISPITSASIQRDSDIWMFDINVNWWKYQ